MNGLQRCSVQCASGRISATTVLFGDAGKAKLADAAAKLVESGSRVVALDLVLQGECLIDDKKHYQYAAMIETTGERVLGQNVAQLGSIVEWARKEFDAPVAIHSKGWVSGVAALMYGGLHRMELRRITTEDAPASLKELVTQRIPYDDLHRCSASGSSANSTCPICRHVPGRADIEASKYNE